MAESKEVVYRGFGPCTTLTLIFLILKLTGAFNWSWFWVFFPLILGYGLLIILFILKWLIENKY